MSTQPLVKKNYREVYFVQALKKAYLLCEICFHFVKLLSSYNVHFKVAQQNLG